MLCSQEGEEEGERSEGRKHLKEVENGLDTEKKKEERKKGPRNRSRAPPLENPRNPQTSHKTHTPAQETPKPVRTEPGNTRTLTQPAHEPVQRPTPARAKRPVTEKAKLKLTPS